jgi:hypothetical protein
MCMDSLRRLWTGTGCACVFRHLHSVESLVCLPGVALEVVLIVIEVHYAHVEVCFSVLDVSVGGYGVEA